MTNKILKLRYQMLREDFRKEQIEIARKILRENEWIIGWCNAMGGCFFTEIRDPGTEDEVEDSVNHDDERIQEMEEFMDAWDEKFRLSGDPYRIDKYDDDSLIEAADW